jgi:uncharacterized protein YjeT (DUF2065 family)
VGAQAASPDARERSRPIRRERALTAVAHPLIAALCLVLVLEGLFLFAAPQAWQRMAEQMRQLEPRQLRIIGGVMVGIGLLVLKITS